MSMQTIDHATLATLVEAGSVRKAHVTGRPEGWSIEIRYGNHARTLIAQRSRHARLFRRLDTLASYLKDVGIAEFDVDANNYEPDKTGTSRPDRAEALRKAHKAAAYDAWFREEVQKAIDEADDPKAVWFTQEEADAQWEKERAELTRLIGDEG